MTDRIPVPRGGMDPSQARWRDIAQRYRKRAVKAEAQRNRLAEACRSVMRQAGDYRDESWTCWSPIFDRVADALADIDKEATE